MFTHIRTGLVAQRFDSKRREFADHLVIGILDEDGHVYTDKPLVPCIDELGRPHTLPNLQVRDALLSTLYDELVAQQEWKAAALIHEKRAALGPIIELLLTEAQS